MPTNVTSFTECLRADLIMFQKERYESRKVQAGVEAVLGGHFGKAAESSGASLTTR